MFLPTLFADGYGIPKKTMGQWSAPIIVMASVTRILGGWLADKYGGLNNMLFLSVAVAILSLIAATMPPIWIMAVVLFLIFCCLGAGNGSTFQLVPLRWTATSAIAMSLIGEVGALGGGLIPNSMGLSKQYFGTFAGGFLLWAAIGSGIFFMYLVIKKRWTTTWVGKGGKALTPEERVRRIREGNIREEGSHYGV
jgi:NNP family nitrate/nitrite transporter-like MFS transporter